MSNSFHEKKTGLQKAQTGLSKKKDSKELPDIGDTTDEINTGDEKTDQLSDIGEISKKPVKLTDIGDTTDQLSDIGEISEKTVKLTDIGDTTDEINNGDEKTDQFSDIREISEKTVKLTDIGDTTDEINNGDEKTDQLSDIGEISEKTVKLTDIGDTTDEINNGDEKTDRFQDGTEFAEQTDPSSSSAKNSGIQDILEEKKAILQPEPNSCSRTSIDETRIQEQILSHEKIWPGKSGKKRHKNLWLIPVFFFLALFIVSAWIQTSSSHLGIAGWLSIVFFAIAGLFMAAVFWFGCCGWTIHRNINRIETWTGVFVPIFRRRRSLHRFSSLVLSPNDKVRSGGFKVFLSTMSPCEFKKPESANPLKAFFQRKEKNSAHETVLISPKNIVLGYHHALKGAKTTAEYLGWPILDLSTGYAYLRDLNSFGSKILDKWKAQSKETLIPPQRTQIVYRRVKESVMIGRKSEDGEVLWEVVFSRKDLVIEGRSFEVHEIENMVIDHSPIIHESGRVDEGRVSGIHVFSYRDSAGFFKGLSLEETEFIFGGMRSVFQGGSISEIFGAVFQQ